MRPSAEIAAQGLRAYEQAGAFERLRRRRALIILYSLCPFVLLLLGWAAGELGPAAAAYGFLAAAIFSVVTMSWNWNRLTKQHTRNLALLVRLDQEYGDDLPWREVERHLDALDRLVSELEHEKSGRTTIDLGPDDEPAAVESVKVKERGFPVAAVYDRRCCRKTRRS